MTRRKRWIIGLSLTAVLGFMALNILAYRHARAMLTYTDAGTRQAPPEELTLTQKASVLFSGVNIPRPETDVTPAAWNLSFSSHTIETSDGYTLGAWHIPATNANTLVILLHGYTAERSTLADDARALHSMAYDCLLLDFRGSGSSSGSYTTIGYDEAVDVQAAMAFAKESWPNRKIVLYGYSMGAVASLTAIERFGIQPDGLVLAATYDSMLTTVRNRFNAMGVPSFPSAECLLFWAGVQHDFNAFTHNPADYASSVTCPTLVLHGSDDTRARLEEGQRLFDALPEPKQLHIFQNLGHVNLASARPDEWRPVVERFLGGISQASSQ